MVLPVPGAPARMTSEPGSSPPPRMGSRSGIPVRSRPMSAALFSDEVGRGQQEFIRQEWFAQDRIGRGGQFGVGAYGQDRDRRRLWIRPQARDVLESAHRPP